MVKCELCGEETENPMELYGRQMCRDCYGFYKRIEGSGCGGCCCGR
ncbi:MAG TPA: hypothetical protein VMW67_00460 [Desulfobacteria bacterium]|nr:hypothetical protein [Desulfobacteria bacterium]